LVSEPDQTEASGAGDDVTVGSWVDLDQTANSQPPLDSDPVQADVIIDPAPPSPSLWARLMHALRGTR